MKKIDRMKGTNVNWIMRQNGCAARLWMFCSACGQSPDPAIWLVLMASELWFMSTEYSDENWLKKRIIGHLWKWESNESEVEELIAILANAKAFSFASPVRHIEDLAINYALLIITSAPQIELGFLAGSLLEDFARFDHLQLQREQSHQQQNTHRSHGCTHSIYSAIF